VTNNEFGAAIADAARAMHHERTLDETLEAIVTAARNSVPGFDQVGISTVDKSRNPRTRAATGELVLTLDKVQYTLNEGPCVDILHDADMVVAPHLRHDQRWPRYIPEAVATGLRSQLAVKLCLDEEGTIGGLNFYSTTSDEVDSEAEALADLFATHAAIALGSAKQRETLNAALQSRKVIGQAIGMIMERYDMDENRSFAFLVRASSTSNIKLHDIALELVDQHNTKKR
jgi:GAF domain-containing protein